jgi:hypothetical protein
MRRLAILMFAAGLAALCACSPPPQPAPASQPKEYVYPDWGFAVRFSEAPAVTDFPASANGDRKHILLVESLADNHDDLVNVVDGSDSTRSDEQVLEDAPANLAAAAHGTPGPITYAAAGKVIGREFLLTRPRRPVSRVRIFVHNKHLYEIIAQSPKGPDDPDSKAFLDSFRLL